MELRIRSYSDSDIPRNTPCGRWSIGPKLGQGGQACVFRARGRSSEAVVKLASSPDGVSALLHEGRLLEAMGTHRNIIKVIDCQSDRDGRAYLVLPRMQCDLFSLIVAEGKLDASDCCLLLLDIIDGVSHMHAAGVVHGDLKPENILLDSEGRAVVADLGAASVVDYAGSPTADLPLCSEPYCSPERLTEGRASPFSSDVWAIGVIALAMLNGTLPWKRASYEDNSFRVWAKGGYFLPETVPFQLRSLLRSVLHVSPDRRPSLAVFRDKVKIARQQMKSTDLGSTM
eukprot:PLAT1361.1.p1 GENE.PLAT1361.1~~PLAT1361.1.p1  ORF type:complete len:286 (-),score=96.71 PLAT1361.1:194-1051(-)